MVDIHNPGRRRLPRCWVQQAVSLALETTGYTGEHVALIFTGDEELRRLNTTYRQLASVTDVLSFRYKPDSGSEPDIVPCDLLGEVYISVPQARRQAMQVGHPTDDELVFLAVHGVLHLCGLDDVTPEGLNDMKSRGLSILEQTRSQDAAQR